MNSDENLSKISHLEFCFVVYVGCLVLLLVDVLYGKDFRQFEAVIQSPVNHD